MNGMIETSRRILNEEGQGRVFVVADLRPVRDFKMTESPNIAWLNGQLVPYSQASVPVWDLGVVAGASISEMARTYHHRPFRLADHLARLKRSCAALGFRLPYEVNELSDAVHRIVAANTRDLAVTADLGIVMFVTAGPNPTYLAATESLEPTVCVHSFCLPFHRWKDAVSHGVRLRIPDRRQLPADSFPAEYKTRNRLHWWLADRDVAARDPGARALLLDAEDRITETATACFYTVLNETVITPHYAVLNSLSRQIVREACDQVGVRFRISDLYVNRIDSFQEAFLSSTPSGLLPVASIDDHTLPGTAPGTIVRLLQQEWTKLTGLDTCAQILHHDDSAASGLPPEHS